MEEEITPVKEFIFDYLEKEKIQEKLTLENSSELTKKIVSDCSSKIAEFEGDKYENLAIFATGIIHYMLTNLLITSQRKITVKDVELDVIVPDLRTLSNKPSESLVICIPKNLDKKFLQKKLEEIKKIQPETKNIWWIFSKELDMDQKKFILTENFSNIFKEINEFLSTKKGTQFKIFKN